MRCVCGVVRVLVRCVCGVVRVLVRCVCVCVCDGVVWSVSE